MKNFTKICGAIGLILSFASQAATPYVTIVSTYDESNSSFKTSLMNRENETLICSSYQPIFYVRSADTCIPSPGKLIQVNLKLKPQELHYVNNLEKIDHTSREICKRVDIKLNCEKE